jgi:hypothetical protein
LSFVAASRLRTAPDSSGRPLTCSFSFSFSLSGWAAMAAFVSVMTSSSCESIDHMVSIRSSPRAVAAGDGASWDEEGRPCSMVFANAVNEVGARGYLGGQRERVAEKRVWYAVTRESTALVSVGVECSCIKYLRLRETKVRVSDGVLAKGEVKWNGSQRTSLPLQTWPSWRGNLVSSPRRPLLV